MTSLPELSDGVSRFMADLVEEGHEPAHHGAVIRYIVIPVQGPFAGRGIETGVSVSEIHGWPTVPPHWIHLPDEVQFASTNTDTTDCPPGWRRHSRDTGLWTMNRKPILVWLAHLRGVLGEAA